MKPLVMFGTAEQAEVAAFYTRHDTPRDVVAFTVDGEYVKDDTFLGKPVVAFEDVACEFPPDQYDMFIALGYSRLNEVRAERFESAVSLGYDLPSYVSSKATVWPGLSVGRNCLILEDNTLQPFIRIGDNVTLWSGNHIGHHTIIHDHCFLTSQVVVSGGVEIGAYTFIGVNATIRDHVRIGERSVIGAGAVILRAVDDEGVYKSTTTPRDERPSSTLPRI